MQGVVKRGALRQVTEVSPDRPTSVNPKPKSWRSPVGAGLAVWGRSNPWSHPMRNPSTQCLPDALTLNPWFDLYFGAVLCPEFFADSLARIPSIAPADRGNALAVAARGWMVLNRPADALRLWERAREVGGAEVESLGRFVLPQGPRLADDYAASVGPSGLRADAWCDAAALHLTTGSLDRAARAIGRALAACPEHGEALHWHRFLSEPGVLAVAADVCGAKPSGGGIGVEDAQALLPTRTNGWMSPERLNRRVLMDVPASPPPGSALARFDHAGIRDYFMATDDDWARVPSTHPLAATEVAVDQLRSLVAERRPALVPARGLWESALASGDVVRVDDVAQLLCALATQDTRLIGVGSEAADWLVEHQRPGINLFAAYRALFAAIGDEPGAENLARKVLRASRGDDLPTRLGAGALALAGRRVAASAAVKPAPPAKLPVVWCSPRTAGRDLSSAARPPGLA